MSVSARLAELRRLRQEGKTQRKINFDEEKDLIYDEVDDREFEQYQRERLRGEDFVIDDDGRGYVDNGAYEWDENGHYGSSEEEGAVSRGSNKRRKNKSSAVTGTRDGDIASIFRTQKRVKPASNSSLANANSSIGDAANNLASFDIDAIINEVSTTPKHSNNSTAQNTPTSRLGSARSSTMKRSLGSGVGSSLGSLGSRWANSGRTNGLSRTPTRRSEGSTTPSLTDHTLHRSGLLSDDPMDEAEDIPMIGSSITDVVPNQQEDLNLAPIKLEAISQPEFNISDLPSSDPIESVSLLPQLPLSDSSDMSTADLKLPLTPSQSSDDGMDDDMGTFNSSAWNLVSDEIAMAENGEVFTSVEEGEIIRFFWTDFAENNDSGGLSLFGKTSTGKSITVIVRNTYRDLMALPRPGNSTEEVIAEMDQYFKRVAKVNVPFKVVDLRDCFATGKPIRSYVNARVPYIRMQMPTEGKTFSQLNGSTATPIEAFMVSRQIMGPCWLDVKVKSKAHAAGWTQIGVECDRPFHIKPVSENEQSKLGVPKLTMMSLCMTTAPDSTMQHEVVSISARVYRNVDEADHDALSLPSTLHTAIRPPQHGVFPPHFKEEVAKHNKLRSKGQNASQVVSLHDSERNLIAWFLALLRRTDPDVIIGHSLTEVHLATFLSRALHYRDKMVSSLGRIRDLPYATKVNGYTMARYFSGRLLLDLKNSFGMDLVSRKCREFTLDEMTKELLGQKRKFLDTNITSGTFLQEGAEGLMEVIRRSEYDTLYVSSIAMKIQMLPLSRQLSNLSGSPWRTTLSGHRSERNDYLLMHEFANNRILIPDKPLGRGTSAAGSYTGGLVFSPVVGLHQSCVLVMDFNSLYPSIIQEYNICFTTVECGPEENDEPKEPNASETMGLLPKLLRTMVERRKAVKSLMKDSKATQSQMAEWEIRQTALKLTANAVYGCLGQVSSRFAAKPLAKLITQKGREALDQTRKLADQNNLRVLYGDTDSVMIHTSATNYNDAIAIGKEFKSVVNSQYRHMEIDIDHVFRQLFLYKKKKYAAVVMSPKGSLKLEFKGLDVVRREYSDICKISFTRALNLLFGLEAQPNANTEEIVDPLQSLEKIYTYLAEFASFIRTGQETPKKFVIRQQLSKELDQYQKLDMPQLLVAKAKIDAGGAVKAKDVIGFIISQREDAEDTRTEAQRAVSYETLVREQLVPDFEYYLVHQVYKPIKRILEVVEGFDNMRLADVMGVPGEKPSKSAGEGNEYDGLITESKFVTIGNSQHRFARCEKLLLSYKGTSFPFNGMSGVDTMGVIVPETAGEIMPYEEISRQVQLQVRKYVNLFYQNWSYCDECKSYVRATSTFSGRKCPRSECGGTSLTVVYSAHDLNLQVMYFKSLFEDAAGSSNSAILSPENQAGLQLVVSECDRFLNRSSFTRINIGRFFT